MNQTQAVIYVTAPMPPELEQRARIAAAKQRISRAELIRQAVGEYLQRVEAKLIPSDQPIQQESSNGNE